MSLNQMMYQRYVNTMRKHFPNGRGMTYGEFLQAYQANPQAWSHLTID